MGFPPKDEEMDQALRRMQRGGRRRQIDDPEHREAVSFWEEIKLRIATDCPELDVIYHVPVGGKRPRGMAGYMKAEGTRDGVPDYCVPLPTAKAGALYIELKAPGGRERPNQRWWRERLTKRGNRSVVCVGAQAAMDVTLSHLAEHREYMNGRTVEQTT